MVGAVEEARIRSQRSLPFRAREISHVYRGFVDSTIIDDRTRGRHYGLLVSSPEPSKIDITALGSADRDKNKDTSTVTSFECEKQLRAQEIQGQIMEV
jgi:hypothetical protein